MFHLHVLHVLHVSRKVGLLCLVLVLLAPSMISAPPAVQAQSLAEEVLGLVNAHRVANGASPLTLQTQLNAAANRHSDDLAAPGTAFSHTGSDGSTASDRITDAGYAWSTNGENILARSDFSSAAIFNQWRSSAGHNANMLNNAFQHMGLDCAPGQAGAPFPVYCTMTLGAGGSSTSSSFGVGFAPDAVEVDAQGNIITASQLAAEAAALAALQDPPLPPNPLANWEGNPQSPTFDGRLNPSAAEYYTVTCDDNMLGIYHAEGALLNAVPVANLLGMDPAGSTWEIGHGMTIARHNDSITVGGHNGNSAPAWGTKEVSLQACLARNGITPPAVTPANMHSASQQAAAEAAAQEPQTCVFVVGGGQTAFGIVRALGITLGELQALNPGTNLSRLVIGQPLTVPGCDTLNPIVVPVIPQAPSPAANASPAVGQSASGQTHTVRTGENLFRIGLRYGVDWRAIAATNGITDVTRLQAGMTLVIP